jgi:hypothetical protein
MVPAQLPATIEGLRTRYVEMDRLHVTRSYAAAVQSRGHCMARPRQTPSGTLDLINARSRRSLQLN